MIELKVTFWYWHWTPITVQSSVPKSTSQPVMLPDATSTNSFGSYVASVAIWIVCPFIELGTSAAIRSTLPNELGVEGVLELPHAVRIISPAIVRTPFLIWTSSGFLN